MRRTHLRLTTTVAAVALATAGCSLFGDGGAKDRGLAAKAATGFLTAWQQGDAAAAAAFTDNPADATSTLSQLRADLAVSAVRITPGAVTPANGEPESMPFDVTLTLAGLGDFAYNSKLSVVKTSAKDQASEGWRVRWQPSVAHPQLTSATKLARIRTLPPRAAIEAADGTDLRDPGSVVGTVGPATKDALANAGPTATSADQVGLTGLQRAFQQRLAGTPGGAVRLVDRATGAVTATLKEFPSTPGQPVRTTIVPRMQTLAERAVADGPKKGNPTSFVVLRPSTGDVLAVVNTGPGFDRALQGRYAPGSTFKVITSAALIGAGMTPSDPAPCEESITVNGRSFHNSDHEKFGVIPLSRAFAVSCNTAFISQRDRIGLDSLATTARTYFGLGGDWHIGVPTFDGSVPAARGRDSLAAHMIGQDEIAMSPLAMASVAATVQAGAFHQPELVRDPAPTAAVTATPLPATTVADLRAMMREVVSQGTAAPALAGKVPADVGVKTGTAEVSAQASQTNAWMIGFHRDLAFGGLVEGGGFGVDAVGPIAREFINAVG